MRLAAPIPNLTEHRRKRLMLWARIWLLWFGDWLIYAFGQRGPIAARANALLNKMTRGVRAFIFLEASAQAGRSRRLSRPYATPRRVLGIRVLRGSKFRRALPMRGDACKRLTTLRQILADPSRLIRSLAARLRAFTFRARHQIIPAPQRERIALPQETLNVAQLEDTS